MLMVYDGVAVDLKRLLLRSFARNYVWIGKKDVADFGIYQVIHSSVPIWMVIQCQIFNVHI